MATTLELATLSAHVYGGSGAPQLPPGWAQVNQASSAVTGFQGAAYKNTSTGEVVVAFAGTNDPRDVRSDLAIANGAIPPQFPQALQFFNDVAIANSGSPIYVTGHSLGGAEAQYVAQDPLTAGRVTGAETFGAPGIRGLPDVIDSSNVINHVAATDPIGNYGDHVGITNVVGALPDPLLPMATAAALGPLAGMGYLAYLSHQMDNYRNFFKNAQTALPPPPYGSPIILDLDGDGVETTSVKAGAYFDHGGNGFAEQTGWVAPDDGMLVWDRNNDGRINDGKELFGNETVLSNGSKAANGFAALAELDTNLDGKVDAADADFVNLRVWKDIDGDGMTSTGELLSLSAAGVQSINTGFANSTFIDAQANEHRQVGSFTRTNGTTGTATDVWFRHDLVYTIAEQLLPVPADVTALPDLQGYGNVYDLQQAIVRDTSGTLKTLVQDFMAQTDPTARNATLEQILFTWTGSEAIDPASRGGNIDARKLAVLEKFYGEAFVGTGGANPIAAAAAPLNQSYQGLSEMMHGQLMAKTHLKDIYNLVTYIWDSATHSLKGNLSAVKTEFENRYALNPTATETLFAEFVRGVKGLKAEATLPLSILRSNEAFAWQIDSFGLTKIEGTALNDTLTGTAASEAIRGGAGDDVLSGDGGNDVLYGQDGNDTLTDSDGSDTIEGGAGDDIINDQGSGTNILRGGDGNDTVTFSYYSSNTIEGGAGDDLIQVENQYYGNSTYANTFAGGSGNDRIQSGASADTYQFNRGDGQDTINDYGAGYSGVVIGTDTLVFGVGIAASDITVSRVEANLLLKINDPANPVATDQITIENWDYSYQRIEQVQFADGSVWTAAQLTNLAMTGTAGADALTLWSDATWADGQGGDDTIDSGYSDAMLYGGDGNDTITDSDGSDTIEGGAGDDVINDQGSGTNVLRGGDGNDTLSYSYYANNTIEGGAGDDLIKVDYPYGNPSSTNTFAGGAGDDRIQSGGSADTYLFNRGDGQDTINDLDYYGYNGTDKLVFGAGIVASDVSVSRAGNHLVIKVADPVNPAAADQLTIENWDSTYQRIEQVQFADGSVWTAAQLTNLAMTGTAGADALTLWSDATWADGQGGNDTITSGYNNATVYGGDGNDTLTDTDGDDTLEGGAGDDVITDSGSGTNILRGGDGNDTVTFSYYSSNTIEGGAGDDLINVNYSQYGSSSYANTFTGGAGNDRIQSGASADTYLFNRGDGQDTINDYGAGYSGVVIGTDTLVFGAGITASDITVSRMGANLVLKINDTANPASADQLTIEDWDSTYQRIEQVQFADGTAWTATDLTNLAMTGTDAADALTLWSDATWADGQGGDDIIVSGYNNATVFGGDGNDVITDSDGDDTIEGGAGDDVINDQSSGTNVLRGGDGNDTITYSYYADNTIDGGAGDDLIKVNGYSHYMYANTITGGTGNDRIQSGSNADTYLFNRGDGQDTINDYDNYQINKTDKLVFGAGITASDITVSRVEANLLLKINDPANPAAADQITVENWDSTYQRIEQVQFADGSVWTAAQLTNLAMTGTAGADALTLWSDATWADGQGGDDTIDSGYSDAMLYGGDGNDTITDSDGSDTIEGGAGDDVINDQGSGTNVLRGGDGNDTLSYSYYANNTIEGGAGDDLIKVDYPYGNPSSTNTFAGGAGDDRIQSGGSADTYLFNRGDGQDTINDLDYYGYNGTDKLVFGAGIAASDITVSRVEANLLLKINDPANPAATDQITVENWDSTYQRIEQVQFADGSVFDLSAILMGTAEIDTLNGTTLNDIIMGYAGNDTLSGGSGSDWLDGGVGQDAMIGGTGDDTFIVDDISDVVTENADEGIDNVQSSVTYTLAANLDALTLTGTAAINATDNTLDNLLIGNSAINTLSAGSGNDILQGGAGNDILKDTAGTNLLAGGAGSDSLSGASGAELYLGGSGNDTLSTGTGTDILAFNRGDGIDTVVASSGQDNTLSLGGGIQNSDLVFRQSGNDLILDTGTSDSILLQGWYASTTNHSILTLQLIEDAAADFAPGGADALRDNKVEQFDFAGLVDRFDQARTANPGLTRWGLSNALLDFYLGGSDSTAIGGDLAYQYGHTGSLGNIGLSGAQSVLGNAQFGQLNQAINQPGLADGLVKLSA